jgi:hypothetical protein
MIKFERNTDRFGDPHYTAVLKVEHCDNLVLGTIVKGEWCSPKRVRYEVFLGSNEKPGAYPHSYEDTLAEAKNEILCHVHQLLVTGLASGVVVNGSGTKVKVST